MALRVERVGPPSTARERLSGRTAPVGVRSGLPARGLLLFGLPFVAAGALVTLVGTRTIPVDDSTVHAPYWVLTVVGVCFALAGLVLWSRALAQARANARAARARRDHPDDPARIDYDWSPDGVRADRWRRVWPGLFGAAFVTLFLSAFNWWAFGAGAPWPVVAGVVLLDVAIAIAWIATLHRIWHGLKFGDSMLRFDAFPFTPPGPVSIRWVPPNGVVTASSGRFTLRCIEEWTERRQTGRQRSAHLVHEERYRDALAFDGNYEFGPGEEVPLRFEMPADAPGTALDADRPVFWELTAELRLPGLDFSERYLVPIYANGVRTGSGLDS